MPSTYPKSGRGVTLAYGTSTFTARIMDLDIDGIECESLETTYLGSSKSNDFGGRTFIPSEIDDPGEVTCEIQYKQDEAPPIGQTPETVTITHPEGATLVGEGFGRALNGISMTALELMTATYVIKLTGDLTQTAAV